MAQRFADFNPSLRTSSITNNNLVSSTEVQKLAHEYLHDFQQVTIGSLELSANLSITQIVEVCSDFEKRGKLVKHLEKISAESAKVLIFIGTKRVADDLTKYLR